MVYVTKISINQYTDFCRCYRSTRGPLLALASSQGCAVFVKLEQLSVSHVYNMQSCTPIMLINFDGSPAVRDCPA